MTTQLKQSGRGFSLVEVVVAGGILSIILIAAAALVKQSDNSKRSLRQLMGRDSIEYQLLFSTASVRVLRESILNPANSVAKSCLEGPGCSIDGWYPFELFETGPGKPRIAGTSANPVRFTREGAKCTALSSTCNLESFAAIRIHCFSRDGAGTCLRAPESIQARVTLRANPTDPLYRDFVNVSGPELAVRDIWLSPTATPNACPDHKVLVGVNSDGTLNCQGTVQNLGYQVVTGSAAIQTGVVCGWSYINDNLNPVLNVYGYVSSLTTTSTSEMKHVVGEVCCPAGDIAVAGGGQCNWGVGGFLEISRAVAGSPNCWFIDCCKYPSYEPSPISATCFRP